MAALSLSLSLSAPLLRLRGEKRRFWSACPVARLEGVAAAENGSELLDPRRPGVPALCCKISDEPEMALGWMSGHRKHRSIDRREAAAPSSAAKDHGSGSAK